MAVNGVYSSNSSSFYTMSNVYRTNSDSGSAKDVAGVDVVKSAAKTDKSKISDPNKKKDTVATIGNKKGTAQKTKQPVVSDTGLRFKNDERTDTTVIQIVDQDSGKVVKEIPAESILNSVAQIWKDAGIKIDQKV